MFGHLTFGRKPKFKKAPSRPVSGMEDPREGPEHPMREIYIRLREEATGEKNPRFFGVEFDKIAEDPRVKSMRVTTQELSFETMPIYRLGRASYFGGRFRTCIKANCGVEKKGEGLGAEKITGFEVLCLESGRRDGGTPFYVMGPTIGVGGFCFGDLNNYMKGLIKNREFFQLSMSVLWCLWHINEDHKPELKDSYRKVDESGGVEPLIPKEAITHHFENGFPVVEWADGYER